ncbi:MAG: hypothetical protein OXU23_17320 [Candidatus Poribacteria bacterium]|nr:hypothetical protein [Candidatus Poribacteria bacterium]
MVFKPKTKQPQKRKKIIETYNRIGVRRPPRMRASQQMIAALLFGMPNATASFQIGVYDPKG